MLKTHLIAYGHLGLKAWDVPDSSCKQLPETGLLRHDCHSMLGIVEQLPRCCPGLWLDAGAGRTQAVFDFTE